MCELLGMESNVPTDITFSFSGLCMRGGKTGPHADGWGLALYQGRFARTFLEANPAAESRLALAWVAAEGGDLTKARQLAQAAAGELGRQGAADLQALALASNAVFAERAGRRIEGQSSLLRAETLAPGIENLRCRLLTELYSARLRRDPQSGEGLRRTIEQAGAD